MFADDWCGMCKAAANYVSSTILTYPVTMLPTCGIAACLKVACEAALSWYTTPGEPMQGLPFWLHGKAAPLQSMPDCPYSAGRSRYKSPGAWRGIQQTRPA